MSNLAPVRSTLSNHTLVPMDIPWADTVQVLEEQKVPLMVTELVEEDMDTFLITPVVAKDRMETSLLVQAAAVEEEGVEGTPLPQATVEVVLETPELEEEDRREQVEMLRLHLLDPVLELGLLVRTSAIPELTSTRPTVPSHPVQTFLPVLLVDTTVQVSSQSSSPSEQESGLLPPRNRRW